MASDGALAAPYRSPDGYRVSPPIGWVLQPTTGVEGLSVVFANPNLDRAGQKPFADNLNVVVAPTSETLDGLVERTKQEMPGLLPNYRITTDEIIVVDGQPAHLLGGTYDQQGIGPVRNLQVTVVNAGKQYTATVTTTAATFEQNRVLAQATLMSLALG